MTNIWGVHMPKQVSDTPLEDGFVSMGWHELGNIFELPDDREAYKTAIAATYPDLKAGAVPVTAGIVYRFTHAVKAGDYVIYPSKHDGRVNIGTFTDTVERVNMGEDGLDELTHRRGVNWIESFPRSDFTQAALYEIGSFITLFAVTKHAAEFLAKVGVKTDADVPDEDTPNDDQVTQRVSAQAEQTTHDFVIKRIHSGLSGYDFEEFTAHLLECMGYTARVSDKSGDGGVDVIAHTDELGFQPPIIKVQCKRQTGQIGEPDANQLLGTLGDGEFGLFITLGSYSRPARLLERNRSKLRLIDGEELVDIILENYGKMSASYRTLIPLKQIYVPDVIEAAE
ncbi:restriction system protein [Octadecabacter temperatus]|uniref:Mrr restriction system protein n=1 Tax=Octadecabacter temperatus TaxID=1458307 RepID=A0A0K0Y4M1_9RHOB|nr:restriction endonuclease [Octadecabacter temperatus]AKS45797.1 Mrr restriction system protein [Octadecabacter temperatus]SIO00748.1 restriction system protein [Octadecabacter temperatus]